MENNKDIIKIYAKGNCYFRKIIKVIPNWKLWYELCKDLVSNTNCFSPHGKALFQFACKRTFRCRSSSSLICLTQNGLSHSFQKKGHPLLLNSSKILQNGQDRMLTITYVLLITEVTEWTHDLKCNECY